ncbi:rhodanese-like domain-containing protein [Lysobacter hankyongensis]|uniref:Rhodanese domain-containing protein n=1 Tax=Lysobacter hankyongensis TaxID=1176535 RepID=A0ABP9AUF9_9GAMM
MTYTAQDLVAQARAVIEEIDPTRLRALQTAGTPVIDVREPAEFAEGHLPGAVNIPRGVLEFQVDAHPAVNFRTDPNLSHRRESVIVYCRTGGRSALAAEALKRLGFDRPLSLAGGWLRWVESGGSEERS